MNNSNVEKGGDNGSRMQQYPRFLHTLFTVYQRRIPQLNIVFYARFYYNKEDCPHIHSA